MKALAVLLELKDCSDYWSEYTVPIGIHERIDEAIQELLTQSDIVESIAANAIINDLKELFAKPDDHIKSLLEEICSLRDQNALLKETKELLAQPEPFKPDWVNYRQGVADSKREPLSDESICEILLKKEWKGFVDLVRIIEKCHNIGGGE